jgi:hypothetical protein
MEEPQELAMVEIPRTTLTRGITMQIPEGWRSDPARAEKSKDAILIVNDLWDNGENFNPVDYPATISVDIIHFSGTQEQLCQGYKKGHEKTHKESTRRNNRIGDEILIEEKNITIDGNEWTEITYYGDVMGITRNGTYYMTLKDGYAYIINLIADTDDDIEIAQAHDIIRSFTFPTKY